MKYKNIPIKSITNENWTAIDWLLGNYCNFKCSYCFDDLNTGTFRIPKLNEIVKNNILHLINQLHLLNRKKIIFHLSGGEPTIYHDFDDLLKFLKLFGKIRIITNGSRTINWWENNINNLDSVIISYHTEFSNLDHIINVSTLLLNKVNLSVHILMNPELFEKGKYAANMLRKKFNNTKLHLQIKLLRDNNGRSVEYTQDQLMFINNFRHSFVYDENFALNTGSMINFFDRESLSFRNKNLLDLQGTPKGFHCFAHHDFLQINQYGDIGKMSCGQLYSEMTNIYSEDFTKKFYIPDQKIICNNDDKMCGCLGLLFATKYNIQQ